MIAHSSHTVSQTFQYHVSRYASLIKRKKRTTFLFTFLWSFVLWRQVRFISILARAKRSALGNTVWSGPDWSEFSDRPCDVIVRLITKKTNIWRWSALLSSALGDKFAGCQLCWDNYSSVCTLNDWQSSFFEEWMNFLPPQGFRPQAKSRGGTLVARAYIKDSTYSTNMQSVYRKNLDLLEQGPRGIGR